MAATSTTRWPTTSQIQTADPLIVPNGREATDVTARVLVADFVVEPAKVEVATVFEPAVVVKEASDVDVTALVVVVVVMADVVVELSNVEAATEFEPATVGVDAAVVLAVEDSLPELG